MNKDVGTDYIWVGNYAHYNDGLLVGDWIALPFDEAGLPRFLEERCGLDAEHDEVGIFDIDLMGPIGKLGCEVGEMTDLAELNALARIARDRIDDVPRVAAYLSEEGERGPLACANALLQADDICAYRMDGDGLGAAGPEERLAYTVLGEEGGPLSLGRCELTSHFDYAAWVRDLLIDGDVTMLQETDGTGGRSYVGRHYINNWACDVDEGVLDPDGVKDAAEELGAPLPALADAVSLLKEWKICGKAVDLLAEEDPDCARACAAVLGALGEDEAWRAYLYAYSTLPASAGPVEYAEVAMQVDGIAGGKIETPGHLGRLGEALAAECGLDTEDLVRYFDYESYGRDLIAEGGYSIAGDWCLDTAHDAVDLEWYSPEEVAEAARALAAPAAPPRRRR